MRQPKSYRKNSRRQRGMAMALTLLVLLSVMGMVLLGLLAGSGTPVANSASGMGAISDSSIRFAADIGRATTALNLADAGVQDTILWLCAQNAPPSQSVAFAPSDPSFVGPLNPPLWNATHQPGSPPRAFVQYPVGDTNNSFSITIYPLSGNPGSTQKKFLIESIGTSYGFKQIVHAYVQQNSFGHYAFFENGAGGGTWDGSYISFDGPVHMNNPPGAVPMTMNYNDGGPPIFTYQGDDAYTVGFGLSYSHNWQLQAGPPAASDSTAWSELSTYGATSLKANQNDIGMPTSTAAKATQKTAALGQLSSAPTTTGATACTGGGIYVHGDVQQMTLSVDPSNAANQIIEMYQVDATTHANVYTKITYDTTANQTVIKTGTYNSSGTITLNPANTQPAPTAGLTNGVVYCDGNIGHANNGKQADVYPEGGLRGTIADNAVDANGNVTHSNALTIATDPAKNTNIDGSIVTKTQRQIQTNSNGQYLFTNSSGQTVTSGSTTTPGGCVPIYVNESADTGQFASRAGRLGLISYSIVEGAIGYDSTGTNGITLLYSTEMDMASYAYDTLGIYHYVPGGNAALIMGSDIHSGPEPGRGPPNYIKFDYDKRLSDNPPPYFPTTSNRYTLLSWQRVSTVIEGTP